MAEENSDNITMAKENVNNITAEENGNNVTAEENGNNVTAEENGNNVTAEENGNNVTAEENGIQGVPEQKEDKPKHSCRICLEDLTPEDEIAAPCKCTGSAKYVHVKCIMSWASAVRRTTCEICGSEYDVVLKNKYGSLKSILICLWLSLRSFIEIKAFINVSTGIIALVIFGYNKQLLSDEIFKNMIQYSVFSYYACSLTICKCVITWVQVWREFSLLNRIYQFERAFLPDDEQD